MADSLTLSPLLNNRAAASTAPLPKQDAGLERSNKSGSADRANAQKFQSATAERGGEKSLSVETPRSEESRTTDDQTRRVARKRMLSTAALNSVMPNSSANDGARAVLTGQLPATINVQVGSLSSSQARPSESTVSFDNPIHTRQGSSARASGVDLPSTINVLVPIMSSSTAAASAGAHAQNDVQGDVSSRAAGLIERHATLETSALSMMQSAASVYEVEDGSRVVTEEKSFALRGGGESYPPNSVSEGGYTPTSVSTITVSHPGGAQSQATSYDVQGATQGVSSSSMATTSSIVKDVLDLAIPQTRDSLKNMGMSDKATNRIIDMMTKSFTNSMLAKDSVDHIAGSDSAGVQSQMSAQPVQQQGYFPLMQSAHSSQTEQSTSYPSMPTLSSSPVSQVQSFGPPPAGYPVPSERAESSPARTEQQSSSEKPDRGRFHALFDQLLGRSENNSKPKWMPGFFCSSLKKLANSPIMDFKQSTAAITAEIESAKLEASNNQSGNVFANNMVAPPKFMVTV